MGTQLPQTGTAPNFRPMSVVAKRLDGLKCPFMEVSRDPGNFALDGDPAPLKKGGGQLLLNFRPMSIVV